MPETTTRVVQVVVEATKKGNPSAPFKEMESAAKGVQKSVKDIQPAAQTTTDRLKKLWSDTRDAAKGSEVQVNRLSKSIRELGLNTQQVTSMAAQLGREWKLTGQQIDEALRKAGQGAMPGGAAPGGGRFSGMLAGPKMLKAGLAAAGVMQIPNVLDDSANLVRLLSGQTNQIQGDQGLISPLLAGIGRGYSGVANAANRGLSNASGATNYALTTRMEAHEQRLLEREERRALHHAQQAPLVDAQRAGRLQGGSFRDEAAGLRGLSGTRDRIEAEQRMRGLSRLGQSAGLAGDVFKGPAGQEQLRGMRDQIGEMAQGQATAEAAARNEVVKSQAHLNRLAQEELAIRRQETPLVADRMEQARQLAAITEQQTQAQQRHNQLVQQENQTRRQGLEQQRQLASSREQMYRQVAAQEKERIQSAKEGFGFLDPMAKRESVDIAKRLAGGQDLTRDQLDLARSQPIFGDALRKYGSDRAGPEFQEIVRLLRATAKGDAADRAADFEANIKVALTNEIKAELKLNEGALASELTTKLVPQLLKIVSDVERAVDVAMQKLRLEMQRARLQGGAQS